MEGVLGYSEGKSFSFILPPTLTVTEVEDEVNPPSAGEDFPPSLPSLSIVQVSSPSLEQEVIEDFSVAKSLKNSSELRMESRCTLLLMQGDRRDSILSLDT